MLYKSCWRVFSLTILTFCCWTGVINADPSKATSEIKKAEFIERMVNKHKFDPQVIRDALATAEKRDDIIKSISTPAESLTWGKYRKIFIKDKRIDGGVKFWQEHSATLLKAQKEFGVDPSIIVAIIGVETYYGKIQGKHKVLDALYTLGFYYPKRSRFFLSELEEYFLLAREEGWPLTSVKGSYAGAMGMGQFISSSYRNFGIDFDGDGKVNLFDNPVDMIGSVANYFKRHHWRANGFVAQPVELNKTQTKLVQKKLKLKKTLAELKAADIDVSLLKGKSKKGGLFAFDAGDKGKEHWLVGSNFYSITRYNHSHLYAMAAFQLSQAIEDKYLNASAITLLAEETKP